jgi:hypothetical protein
MPEANVLYTVTAIVVAALVAWVVYVLKSAKEPWARAAPVSAESEASRAGAKAEALVAGEAGVGSEAPAPAATDADVVAADREAELKGDKAQ